jgi:ribosomal protein L9
VQEPRHLAGHPRQQEVGHQRRHHEHRDQHAQREDEVGEEVAGDPVGGEAEREAAEAAASQEKAAKLARLVLAFELKQAQEGAEKLFGAITSKEIAAALVEKGFEVEHRDITLAKVINQVGEHDVTVDLGYSVKVQIKVKVTGNTDENFEKPAKARRPRKSATADVAKEELSE